MEVVAMVLVLVYAGAVWFLYHKIFDVVYFNLSKGLGKEIVCSLFAGMILAGLTLVYWWVMIVLIAAITLVLVLKCRRSEQRIAVIIVAVVVALLIAVTGIGFNKQQESGNNSRAYRYIMSETSLC